MTIIMPSRRRFLFLAPAIVAASSLMPGHSIAKLLVSPVRTFVAYHQVNPLIAALTGTEVGAWVGWRRLGESGLASVSLTRDEIAHYELSYLRDNFFMGSLVEEHERKFIVAHEKLHAAFRRPNSPRET